MPCDYVVDNKRMLVITTASGVLTAAEAFAHQASLAVDPGFNPGFYQLIDFTEVEKLAISTDDLRRLAKKTIFLPRVRRAMLVKGSMLYGVARMLASFRELAGGKEEVKIFQDRKEAMDWLGVSI